MTGPPFLNVVVKFSPVARRSRYRGRTRMLRNLGADLASTTTWSTVDTELHTEITEVADRTPRVHQLPDHWRIYESVVDRTRPVRLLEIGGFYGDSLEKWREFLHPDSLVVGVDVDSKLVKIANPDGVRVRLADGQARIEPTIQGGVEPGHVTAGHGGRDQRDRLLLGGQRLGSRLCIGHGL